MKRLSLRDAPTNGTTNSLLIGGDFCPVGRFADAIQAGREIFDPALASLFSSSYTLLNLEAPLCTQGVPADSPSGSGLRGTPAVASYLGKLGVDAVSLANNHARDFGDEGIRQTLANLAAAGVECVGAGGTLAIAEQPLEVTLGGIKVGIWALAERELNVADEHRAGTSCFSPERNLPTITQLKERCDIVVIIVHAGHEFITIPSPRIRDAYRRFVTAGADAVIAHHPHVMQGVEQYQGGVIAYSLGNLVFDTPYVDRYEGTDEGYLVRLQLGDNALSSVDIIPYKIHDGSRVSPLDSASMRDFERHFETLSGNITDDRRFEHEWELAAAFRWETEYRRVLHNFSNNLTCHDNPDYARRSRNLFTCPTHVEMIEKIFLMLEVGKLSREPAKESVHDYV